MDDQEIIYDNDNLFNLRQFLAIILEETFKRRPIDLKSLEILGEGIRTKDELFILFMETYRFLISPEPPYKKRAYLEFLGFEPYLAELYSQIPGRRVQASSETASFLIEQGIR